MSCIDYWIFVLANDFASLHLSCFHWFLIHMHPLVVSRKVSNQHPGRQNATSASLSPFYLISSHSLYLCFDLQIMSTRLQLWEVGNVLWLFHVQLLAQLWMVRMVDGSNVHPRGWQMVLGGKQYFTLACTRRSAPAAKIPSMQHSRNTFWRSGS